MKRITDGIHEAITYVRTDKHERRVARWKRLVADEKKLFRVLNKKHVTVPNRVIEAGVYDILHTETKKAVLARLGRMVLQDVKKLLRNGRAW